MGSFAGIVLILCSSPESSAPRRYASGSKSVPHGRRCSASLLPTSTWMVTGFSTRRIFVVTRPACMRGRQRRPPAYGRSLVDGWHGGRIQIRYLRFLLPGIPACQSAASVRRCWPPSATLRIPSSTSSTERRRLAQKSLPRVAVSMPDSAECRVQGPSTWRRRSDGRRLLNGISAGCETRVWPRSVSRALGFLRHTECSSSNRASIALAIF
mmetsp:Transcript_118484/g.335088  ORF Transcript_118484/g.335088 Transcript_118484/m.335088 type:complete len:211 (-) Transcript_118484:6-638(-)